MNISGRKFDLVYNQSTGFDNFLTNFYQLKKAGLLKGNGRAYYFDFAPDTKFTQKNVANLYNTNKEWASLFDKAIEELYFDYLNSTAVEGESEIELVECVDEANNIWRGSDDNFYDGESGEPVEYQA